MAFVYWIHLPEHTDMFSEGYIGFTSKTVGKRFTRHKSDAKAGSRLHIHLAIMKYGERLLCDTLLEASEDYCKDVEYKLRKLPYTGWNLAVGGTVPTLGVYPSDETRLKMAASARANCHVHLAQAANRGRKQPLDERERRANSNRGRCRSDTSKKRMVEGNAKKKPWQNSQINLNVLSVTPEAYALYIDGCSVKESEYLLGQPSQSLRHTFVKFKNLWNPNEDLDLLEWLATYKKEATDATPTTATA